MHSAYSGTCQDTSNNDSNYLDTFVETKEVEGDAQDANWQEEGRGGISGIVLDLELPLSICHDDGSVSNVVHRPNRHRSHRNGGTDEQIPKNL